MAKAQHQISLLPFPNDLSTLLFFSRPSLNLKFFTVTVAPWQRTKKTGVLVDVYGLFLVVVMMMMLMIKMHSIRTPISKCVQNIPWSFHHPCSVIRN